MEYRIVEVDRRGEVVFVRINRPDALNALDEDVVKELSHSVETLSQDEKVNVLVITGAGDKAFVAGADIRHMSGLSPIEVFEFVQRGQNLTFIIENSPKIVIAMVNGFALGGGCELSLACDLIIASENAFFGQPEVKLGIIPGMGGTQRLSRIIGRNLAKELILTGDPIDARRAYEIGLVSRVVPLANLEEETLRFAGKIASQAPFALSTAKRAINKGIDISLESACYLELNSFALGFSTKDKEEGFHAFLEKRKPRFEGK